MKGKGIGINSHFGYTLIDAGDINLDGYNGMYYYLNVVQLTNVLSNQICSASKYACLLTLSCIMLKIGQTYFKNLTLWTLQDFKGKFGHFSTFCMKELFKIKSISKKYILRSIIETLKKMRNIFKAYNKDTRTMSVILFWCLYC